MDTFASEQLPLVLQNLVLQNKINDLRNDIALSKSIMVDEEGKQEESVSNGS